MLIADENRKGQQDKPKVKKLTHHTYFLDVCSQHCISTTKLLVAEKARK
jgi:hypothetical protein